MIRRVVQHRTKVAMSGLAAALAFGFAAPPLADAQEASSEPAPPFDEGEIIYSRDVHHSIGAPFFLGPTQSVVTGPTNMIVQSVDDSLRLLTDDETALVSASLAPPASVIQRSLGAEPNALVRPGESSLAAGERSGSVVGKTIDGAMDSLSSALGTMSSILGSSQ